MFINIIIEPEYKYTVWCKETLNGVNIKASSLRYKLNYINENEIKEPLKQIVAIGTSPLWVSEVIKKAQAVNVMVIAVSCQPQRQSENACYVLIKHDYAIESGIKYLNDCKKNKIALYGINKDSYADMIKAKYFEQKDIFYNAGENGLESCFNKFLKSYTKYNAVICSNYISAISLISKLKKFDICVPNDLYIITFGDSILGRLYSPSVTTITLDHERLGKQAVSIYSYLMKQEDKICITVSVLSKIIPQGSTEYKVFSENEDSYDLFSYNNSFLCDSEIKKIQNLEKMLRYCESIDHKIIKGLIQNKQYHLIADEIFSSQSAIKYRIKRLLSASGIEDLSEMLKIYKQYLSDLDE